MVLPAARDLPTPRLRTSTDARLRVQVQPVAAPSARSVGATGVRARRARRTLCAAGARARRAPCHPCEAREHVQGRERDAERHVQRHLGVRRDRAEPVLLEEEARDGGEQHEAREGEDEQPHQRVLVVLPQLPPAHEHAEEHQHAAEDAREERRQADLDQRVVDDDRDDRAEDAAAEDALGVGLGRGEPRLDLLRGLPRFRLLRGRHPVASLARRGARLGAGRVDPKICLTHDDDAMPRRI